MAPNKKSILERSSLAPKKGSIALFVSHSHQDEKLAKCLLDTIKIFFEIPDASILCTSLAPYGLPGGANIAATLQTKIRKARAVIGILTPNSMASPWVLCELGAVWGLVTHFVPVLAGLEPDKLTGPLGVAHVWRLDVVEDVRMALNELGRHLEGIAERRHQSQEDEDSALNKLLSFSATYKPDTDMVPAAELYSLHLSSKHVRKASKVFQDFDVSRGQGTNLNAVQTFWADTYTNSSIKALVVKEPNDRYLRIWFVNGHRTLEQGEFAKGWASNIHVRPQEGAALGNEAEQGGLRYKALEFFARGSLDEEKDGDIEQVGLAVRLLDRRQTNWAYTMSPGAKFPTQFLVTNVWQPYRVLLEPQFYSLYTGAGNRWFLKYNSEGDPVPDFTVMPGMTFVLGSYTGGIEEPGPGKGVVDIKDITLTE